MGELRLYAVGLEEVRGVFGAPDDQAVHLREVARRAFAAPPDPARSGMLSKLGPIFRRPPGAVVLSPTQPEPHDVEVLLAGGHVRPQRTGATWRVLETFVCDLAWDSTRLPLSAQSLEEVDFALARGGVASSVGLRHLLDTTTALPLMPVPGLTVGWHRHATALAMAAAYRVAAPQLETSEQRDLVTSLASWLDGFVPWARAAAGSGRPAPDLVGFWAS